jgi:hypothetical protein
MLICNLIVLIKTDQVQTKYFFKKKTQNNIILDLKK